jgi:uncharacterized protein
MQGSAASIYDLGLAKRHGVNVRVNARAARACFAAAMARGHAKARVDLASMLADGEGGPRDKAQAIELLEDGVRNAESASMVELGRWKLRGRAVTRAPAAGVKLLRRADQAGNAAAAATLAYAYRRGVGVPRSERQAQTWLRRGAALGHADCQLDLAQQYEQSGRNLARAFALVKSAAKGNLDPYPRHVLGYYCVNGIGTKVDLAAAKRWYGSAAEEQYLPSMYNLARLLLPSDRPAAMKLLVRAARHGHRGSRRMLRMLRAKRSV